LLIGVMVLALGLASQAATARWQPRPTTESWQWQLQGKVEVSLDVPVFDVDGLETPARTVRRLHQLHSDFAAPLEQRFAISARKGFDAVEPDNLAGWEKQDRFQDRTRRPAAIQHLGRRASAPTRDGRGALKDDGRQARKLVDEFDFAPLLSPA
jgi:hypothetical protein